MTNMQVPESTPRAGAGIGSDADLGRAFDAGVDVAAGTGRRAGHDLPGTGGGGAGAETLVACSLDHAPDLVEVRERFPRLAALWNAVHDHFWTTYRTPGDGAADISGRRVR